MDLLIELNRSRVSVRWANRGLRSTNIQQIFVPWIVQIKKLSILITLILINHCKTMATACFRVILHMWHLMENKDI